MNDAQTIEIMGKAIAGNHAFLTAVKNEFIKEDVSALVATYGKMLKDLTEKSISEFTILKSKVPAYGKDNAEKLLTTMSGLLDLVNGILKYTKLDGPKNEERKRICETIPMGISASIASAKRLLIIKTSLFTMRG